MSTLLTLSFLLKFYHPVNIFNELLEKWIQLGYQLLDEIIGVLPSNAIRIKGTMPSNK